MRSVGPCGARHPGIRLEPASGIWKRTARNVASVHRLHEWAGIAVRQATAVPGPVPMPVHPGLRVILTTWSVPFRRRSVPAHRARGSVPFAQSDLVWRSYRDRTRRNVHWPAGTCARRNSAAQHDATQPCSRVSWVTLLLNLCSCSLRTSLCPLLCACSGCGALTLLLVLLPVPLLVLLLVLCFRLCSCSCSCSGCACARACVMLCAPCFSLSIVQVSDGERSDNRQEEVTTPRSDSAQPL